MPNTGSASGAWVVNKTDKINTLTGLPFEWERQIIIKHVSVVNSTLWRNTSNGEKLKNEKECCFWSSGKRRSLWWHGIGAETFGDLGQRANRLWMSPATGAHDVPEKGKDVGGAWHTVTERKSGRKGDWQIGRSSVALWPGKEFQCDLEYDLLWTMIWFMI